MIVAIAPGPNMSGIARGTNAMLASPALAPERPKSPPDFLGMNSSNPIFIRMIPPTMRTMLSGTPNSRRMNVPKMKKKKQSNSEYRQAFQATARCVASSLPDNSLR